MKQRRPYCWLHCELILDNARIEQRKTKHEIHPGFGIKPKNDLPPSSAVVCANQIRWSLCVCVCV